MTSSRDRPLDLPPPEAYPQAGEADRPGALWDQPSPGRLARPAPPSGAPPGPRPPGRGWLGQGFERNTVFVGFALALGAFAVLNIGLGAYLVVAGDISDKTELLATLIATLVIDAVVLVVVPFLVLGGGRRALAALGLRRPSSRDLGWAFAGLALSWVLLGAYLGLVEVIGVGALEPVSTIDEDEIYGSVGLVALTGVLVVLVAPVAEEIFYRGFLFGGLSRRFGVLGGAAASAALFAAVHLDVGSLIPFALIGLVFAFIYVRSGSLLSAIMAHFMFNVIGYVATIADRGVG